MKYAIAILDIKPAEFWELTLAEFNVAMEAYEWKEYQESMKRAQHAQWVMGPHVKSHHIPSIEQMVGESPEAKEEKENKKATTKDDLEKMKARMGI